MKTTSFFLGIVLIVGAYEVRQASSSAAAADQVLQTLQLSNCDDLKVRLACFQRKYRTIDGTCNNLCNITRGAANRPLRRLLPNAYQQPGNQPRSQSVVQGKSLSNVRFISRRVFDVNNTADINRTVPDFTHLTMTWGQFLDHDITLTELTQGVECGINNETCSQNPDCVNIDIPVGDELQFNQTAKCIPLPRSLRNENGEQINIITSYIDGSQVYGSDDKLAKRLRSPKGNGRLDERVVRTFGERPRLPPSEPEAFCRSPNRDKADCFLAGDVRVNENQALMAMHTLWVREHNRIARNLHELNPTWGDERLFQEARRIVIAELQHITYNEWLAVLFNRDLRRSEGLLLEPEGAFFTGYDPTVNPEIINSFATAALRMGHTLIRDRFNLISPLGRRAGFVNVRDFFNPVVFFNERGINAYGGIMRGLTGIRARNFDHFFVQAVGERLIIEGPTIDGIVGDLPAINCQRGRDHGLPGYTAYREVLGGGPAQLFTDLLTTITQARIISLKSAYAAVKDIDLFAGAINEFPAKGSVLGFTFTKILTQQFRDLRFGDRFWYERDDHQTGFTQAQLDEIRKSSMARIICDNTDGVIFIQPKAFLPRTRRSGSNPLFRCRNLDSVNLKVFSEESGGSMSGEANEPVSV